MAIGGWILESWALTGSEDAVWLLDWRVAARGAHAGHALPVVLRHRGRRRRDVRGRRPAGRARRGEKHTPVGDDEGTGVGGGALTGIDRGEGGERTVVSLSDYTGLWAESDSY